MLRIQSDLLVKPDKPKPSDVGEWKSMGISNYLLSASLPPTHARSTPI